MTNVESKTNLFFLDDKREEKTISSPSFGGEPSQVLEDISRLLGYYSIIAKSKAHTISAYREGETKMGDEWLKVLIERIDQDRRDSDSRIQESVNRIEHLMQRESDQMEATRREIQEQNRAVNSRIDTAYTVFVGSSIATFVAVAALVLTVIFALLPLFKK